MVALGPFIDSLEACARQIHSIAAIIRSIEEEKRKEVMPMRKAREAASEEPPDPEDEAIERGAGNDDPAPILSAEVNPARLPKVHNIAPVIEGCAAPVEDTLSADAVLKRIRATQVPRLTPPPDAIVAATPPRIKREPYFADEGTPTPKRHRYLTVVIALTILIAALIATVV